VATEGEPEDFDFEFEIENPFFPLFSSFHGLKAMLRIAKLLKHRGANQGQSRGR
jgi:hypothetical protein